jgi:hypothetical protein
VKSATVGRDLLSDGAVDNAKIKDAANIAQSKIEGLISSLGDRPVKTANETISGNYSFLNPVRVPQASNLDEAVSLLQLQQLLRPLQLAIHPPVQTLADARAIDANNLANGTILNIVSTLGLWQWDEASTDVDNGSSVIQLSSRDATLAGRLILLLKLPQPKATYVVKALALPAGASAVTLAQEYPNLPDDDSVQLWINGFYCIKGVQFEVSSDRRTLHFFELGETSDIELRFLA